MPSLCTERTSIREKCWSASMNNNVYRNALLNKSSNAKCGRAMLRKWRGERTFLFVVWKVKNVFFLLLFFVSVIFYLCVCNILSLFIDHTNKKERRHLGADCRERKRMLEIARNSSRIYQIAQSRDGDRGSRGSLQGSTIVSILGFLPSFSFKNKTRGAVDNACRCASVIIKSRRTRAGR